MCASRGVRAGERENSCIHPTEKFDPYRFKACSSQVTWRRQIKVFETNSDAISIKNSFYGDEWEVRSHPQGLLMWGAQLSHNNSKLIVNDTNNMNPLLWADPIPTSCTRAYESVFGAIPAPSAQSANAPAPLERLNVNNLTLTAREVTIQRLQNV